MRFLGCLWKVFVRDGVKTKEVRKILGIKNILGEVEKQRSKRKQCFDGMQ